MVPLILSLGLAAGVFLIYDGLTRPPTAPNRRRLATRMAVWLRRAGVPDVGARDFVLLSLVGGLVAGFVAQRWLGLPVVSIGVALFGAALPTVFLQARQERR